jgi:DNA modification methylase
MKITDLKSSSYNPRKISDTQIKMLERDLEELGDLSGIVYDVNSGTLIGGHQRVKIFKNENPDIVIEKKYDKPTRTGTTAKGHFIWKDEQFSFRQVSWNEKQCKKANIVANKAGGDWDDELLIEFFDEEDLLDFGFSEDELSEIGFDVENLDTEETEGDDDLPEKSPAITVKGDLYELGDHRLFCGDSTMIDDVDKLMDGVKANMVYTDPPYGVSYQSNMRVKSDKFDVLENDDKFIVDWLPFLKNINDGFIFIWTSWKVLYEWIGFTDLFGSPSNIIIWDKGGGGLGDLEKTFSSDYEVALVWHNDQKLTGKRIGSVWDFAKDSASNYEHPTQKPISLAVTAINSVTKKNNSVLDLFLGSGSTLIACEKTKRKCYGMELDERYCDVIVKRYVDFCKKNKRSYSVKINGKECKDFG